MQVIQFLRDFEADTCEADPKTFHFSLFTLHWSVSD